MAAENWSVCTKASAFTWPSTSCAWICCTTSIHNSLSCPSISAFMSSNMTRVLPYLERLASDFRELPSPGEEALLLSSPLLPGGASIDCFGDSDTASSPNFNSSSGLSACQMYCVYCERHSLSTCFCLLVNLVSSCCS